ADWVVVAVVALAALVGLANGLVRGALSLAGFALGAYLGARVAPDLLSDGSRYAPLVALAGALLGGTFLQAVAGGVGGAVRTGLGAIPGLRLLDSLGGVVLGATLGVLLCWAVAAVLLYLPGQSELRRSVQRSEILSRLNDEFPPERLLETIERVDPLGVVPGPEATVPRPNPALLRDPDVVRASRSVVRVSGIACGLGVEGSGWIVAPGLVVTNAHVVAGVERPLLDRREGSSVRGTVVYFDADSDVALVRAPSLSGQPLPLAAPDRGVPVVLAGYPQNGPLRLLPGRLGATREVFSRDAYGRGPLTKTVTVLRGDVRPGSSGGPGIDARGRVRTTVFARRVGDSGGYGIPSDLVREAVSGAGTQAVPETDCVRT
ncbi:MAG TPA: MarP family serine protease, partial [Gaiellaceae bacterium]|nr:MarP family serine protease [Gaiellaceae bacterium]